MLDREYICFLQNIICAKNLRGHQNFTENNSWVLGTNICLWPYGTNTLNIYLITLDEANSLGCCVKFFTALLQCYSEIVIF